MIKPLIIDSKKYVFSLSDDEIKLLTEFITITKNIQKLPLLKNFSTSYTISGKVDEPIQINLKAPSEEELSVFLHKIRPLILQEERTHFNN